jgi:universal stress protein E
LLVKPHPMSGRPRIIAAVDPLHEHDQPAELDHRIVEAAHELRRIVNGELYLVHAYEIAPAVAVSADSLSMPITMPLREVTEALKKQHSDAVMELADRHGIEQSSVRLQEGATRTVLVRLTEQMKADIVVLGAVSRSGLRRLFLGSTAEQVLDRLPCDMLIVKPAEATQAERRRHARAAERPVETL